jgi:hypothetical protein
MYNALKEKLYGQEGEIKKFEEEIFSLNAKMIETEQDEANKLEQFDARLKEEKNERDRIVRDSMDRERTHK